MNDTNIRMVGAKLDQSTRDNLAFVLRRNGRTFKAQLERWIEQERRFILANEAR